MKQKLIILITLLSVSLYANAQEYRLAKSSGTLKLNITGVIVEGYDGKDIVFSGDKVAADETSDERAKGLVPISSSKYSDNTGLGINVSENGQDVNVNLVSKKPIGVLTIKVPNNIKISILSNNNNGLFYSYSGGFNSAGNSTINPSKTGDEIVLKNLKSEIEVSVYSNKIRLENNTGPMSIKTVSGSVDAIFTSEIKGPVSIISVTNYVDVTLPASTKANIEMGTNYGKLYAGKEFKIDLDKEEEKSVYNIRTNGVRYAERLSGLTRITKDDATSVSGVQIKGTGTSNKKASSAKAAKDEIVVTGYPAGAIVITKENTKGKDTVNLQTALVTDFQINGNGIATTNQIAGDYTATTRAYSISSLWNGGDRIKGKLNGGGIDLIFKSTNKNVYLRQQ